MPNRLRPAVLAAQLFGAKQSGGAGGIATGLKAFAFGASARAVAYQTGGAGGSGSNGASGGAGANSTLSTAVEGHVTATAGSLKLEQTATGGDGGYSTIGIGGRGGSAISALSFDDTQNHVTASELYGKSTAVGGAGGTGDGGGAAGTAYANVFLVGAAAVTARAFATGGTGALIGAGGAAIGARAAAVSTATSGVTYARADETGGRGGADHVGGGAGGAAYGSFAHASGHDAQAVVVQTGGAGGNAPDAYGGAGGNSTLINGVSGSTSGGTLKLNQTAIGGAGGDSTYYTGGRGGNASSSLSFDGSAAILPASSIYGRSTARGGKGGIGYAEGSLYVELYGPSNGGAGGSASASVHIKGVNTVVARAYTYGGAGGYLDNRRPLYATDAGGDGGAVSGTTGYAAGHSASVTASQTGGAGGGAGPRHPGRKWRQQRTLVDAVSGRTTGGYLKLFQTATGGAGGGGSEPGSESSGGRGGSATSILDFDDTPNPVHASSLYGKSSAIGGAGGGGFTFAPGGAAYAKANLTGADSVSAVGYARGGAGGGFGSGGGGDAYAGAVSLATGLDASGTATAQATAIRGAGFGGGKASASSVAETSNGQLLAQKQLRTRRAAPRSGGSGSNHQGQRRRQSGGGRWPGAVWDRRHGGGAGPGRCGHPLWLRRWQPQRLWVRDRAAVSELHRQRVPKPCERRRHPRRKRRLCLRSGDRGRRVCSR